VNTNPDLQKICIANPKLSKCLICIVINEYWVSKLWFDPWPRILKIFKRFNLFSRILMNLHESLVLYTKRILTNKPQIWVHGFISNCDWQIQPVFKLPISWMRFGDLFLKDLFLGFNSIGQKSQKIWFVLICRDSSTNPATLC